MGYPPREEHPGLYYHVGTRGNNLRDIYSDDATRLIFLSRLAIVAARHEWIIPAYCQMTNHYHLVLKLGDSGMRAGMKELNGAYASAFNARNGRRDHLFGRRYWSRQIESEEDLVNTCRYIELNPYRSLGQCRPEHWRWSSHRAAAGIEAPAPFHSPQEIWNLFGGEPRVAMHAWSSFVETGLLETSLHSPRLVSDTGFSPRAAVWTT